MGVTDSPVPRVGPQGEGERGGDTKGSDSADSERLAVLDALGDTVSREILVAAADGDPTVDALARRCGVSASTVYRRLDGLDSLGLVERVTSLETDSVGYRTTMRGLYVAVDGDGISVAFEDGDVENGIGVTPEDGVGVTPEDGGPADGSAGTDLAAAFALVREAIAIDRLSYDRAAGQVEVCFSLADDEFEAFLDPCVRRR